MGLVSCSTAPAPRYLFRTQLPNSRSTVNTNKVRTNTPFGFIPLAKALTEGTPVEQWGFQKAVTEYVVEGVSANNCAVAWTSSLAYALARARIMTHDFFKEDTDSEGKQMAFIEEHHIEIFVVDTSVFPPGTFISVRNPLQTAPGVSTDYVTSDLELPLGCCARVTLQELYDAGLKTLFPPYRNVVFNRVRPTVNHIYVKSGESRDLNEYTSHIAQLCYDQWRTIPLPKTKALKLASEIANLFPTTFEVPMFLAFLSLYPPPEVSACYTRIKYKFGVNHIVKSLADLHLESVTNWVWFPRFSHIAEGVKCRQEAEDMLALEETLRDTPFKESGGEENEMWM